MYIYMRICVLNTSLNVGNVFIRTHIQPHLPKRVNA